MTLLTRRRTLIGVAVALAATACLAAGATTADATTADATPPAGVINLYTSGTLATPHPRVCHHGRLRRCRCDEPR